MQKDNAFCHMSLPLISSNRSSSRIIIDKQRADKIFGKRAAKIIAVLRQYAADYLSSRSLMSSKLFIMNDYPIVMFGPPGIALAAMQPNRRQRAQRPGTHFL